MTNFRRLSPRRSTEAGENGGIEEFANVDAAIAWLAREEGYWKWLSETPPGTSTGHVSVWGIYSARFDHLKTILDHADRTKALADFTKAIAPTLQEDFESYNPKSARSRSSRFRRTPLSTSPFGKYVLDLAGQNKDCDDSVFEFNALLSNTPSVRQAVATSLLSIYLNVADDHENKDPRISAIARSLLANWYISIKQPLRHLRQALLRLEEVTLAVDHHAAELDHLKSQALRRSALYRRIASKRIRRLTKQHESHATKMRSIEHAFMSQHALRAPVEHWTNKQKEHTHAAQHWLVAAGLTAFAGILWLTITASYLFPTAEELLEKVVKVTPDKAVASSLVSQLLIGSAIKFAVIAGVFAWALRIIVRNYLSRVHLSRDAEERAVILTSFIAMTHDKDLQSLNSVLDKGFPLALESVFRHTADGIVKDDGLPSTSLFSFAKGSD